MFNLQRFFTPAPGCRWQAFAALIRVSLGAVWANQLLPLISSDKKVSAVEGSNRSFFFSLLFKFLAFALIIGQPVASYAQDYSSWMANEPTVRSVPLKGIAIPGTHDSFSYVSLPFAGNLVDSYYLTQTLDIPGQLQAGVRHFDMRTLLLGSNSSCNNAPGALPFSGPGYYMYVHNLACTGVRLENVLDQMSAFLDAHPQEIILLHFSGNVQSGPPTYQTSAAFEAVLDQHLRRASDGASYIYDAQTACNLLGPPWDVLDGAGSYFPTAQYAGYCISPSNVGVLPQEVTPQQLYTTSARVIAVEEFGLTGSGYFGQLDSAKLTWPMWTYQAQSPDPPFFVERLRGYYDPDGGAGSISQLDTWMEQGTPDSLIGLYGTRPIGAGYESDTEFLTLQAELTPGGANFISNVYGAAPPLIQAGEGGENAHLATLLGTTWTPYSVNVVQVDYANYCFDPSSSSNTCLGINPTVAGAIINFNNQTFGRVSFGTLGASQISVGHDGSVYATTGATYGASGVLGQNYVLAKRVGNTGTFTDWQSLNAAGNRIAADPNGGIWVLDNSGSFVTHYNASLAPVAKVLAPTVSTSPQTIKDISVDNTGTLYALSGYTFSGTLIAGPAKYSNGQWVGLAGLNVSGNRIASNNSVVAVLDTNGNLQQYAGGNWTPLDQPFTATSVAVDDGGQIWATQAETATGAYPGYNPLPTSSVWKRVISPFGGQWQQFSTQGVQVGVGTSASGLTPDWSSGTDTVYVTDKTGHTHSLTYTVASGPNQGQAPPPKRYAPQIAVSGLTFNHASQVFSGTLTVTNNTGSAITDQLAVLFVGLPSGVTIANNPLSYQGEPFILMPPGALQAGASVSMQVQFKDPNLSKITYSNIVYAYVAGS